MQNTSTPEPSVNTDSIPETAESKPAAIVPDAPPTISPPVESSTPFITANVHTITETNTVKNDSELREANKLTPDEKEAILQLKGLAENEGIKYHSMYELAMFVLVAKRDVTKAFNRLKHLRSAEEKHGLDSVDSEDALSTLVSKCSAFMCSSGCTNDKKTIVSIDYSQFNPGDWQGEENLRKLLKALIVSRNAAQNTLERVRNGAVMVVQARNLSWRNFSLEMEKTISSVLQDAYPMRTAGIIILNPPFLIRAMIKLMSPFLKKKMIQRTKICKLQDIPKSSDAGATETTSPNYQLGLHTGILHKDVGGEFSGSYVEHILSENITRKLSEKIVEGQFE